jgi:ribosomal protein S18 acetylase RimI-like enzyme
MVSLRKATLNDSTVIATYLFLAMEDIVYKFIGEENPDKGRDFILRFTGKENNQYSYQNCWVAEDDKKVVAAINLYDGALLHDLRQPVFEYVRLFFDKNFNPEDETKAGEVYIDTLAVHPGLQGKGIGTKLLQFVIDEYVHRQNQTLGLLVDDTNPDAKRFYLRMGFKVVEKRIVFGRNMEHLQMTS